MSYQTIWTDRGVEWIYHGTVTGKEIIQSNEEIYGDPRFDDLRYQLVDLTQVERFEVSDKEMRQMAYLDAAAARTNPRIRLAVIATGESGRSVFDAYAKNIKNPVWKHELFSSRKNAEDWLGIR